MKLRQKLAVLLTMSAVVTAVPVVTMASSENRVTKTLTNVKDTVYHQANTSSALVVEANDYTVGEVFYLELENAEWKDSTGTILAETANCEVEIQGKSTAKVTITGKDVRIPLLVKLKGGEAKVIMDGGGYSSITEDSFVFAKTPTSEVELISVSAGKPTTIYDGGKIADIVFKEVVAQSTKGKTEKERTIEVELNHSDYRFDLPAGKELTIEYKYGLSGETAKAKVSYDGSDKSTILVVLPELKSNQKGSMTIKGLEVSSTTRKPEEGVVTVDISGDIIEDQNALKVATVTEKGVSLVSEEKPTILAGRSDEIVFTLTEDVADTLSIGRTMEFTLENGYFAIADEDEDDSKNLALVKEAISSIKVHDATISKSAITDVIIDKIGDVDVIVGFEFTVPTVAVDEDEKLEFKFTSEIGVDINAEGEAVKITADGKAIDEELSVEVAKIQKPVTIDYSPMKLEVGYSKQTPENVLTIKENDKGNLVKGEVLVIALDNANGVKFGTEPEFKVTEGDLVLGEAKLNPAGNRLEIEVKKASKTASTIKVSGFEMTVTRVVADGDYTLLVGGEAITDVGAIEIKDFIKIGTNGAVVPSYSSIFTIDDVTYTVNGETKTMDASPYLSDNGRTMLPVRYVAEALGINGEDILWSGGSDQTVTIFSGSKVVQLKVGQAYAIVNGVKVAMDEATAIVDGRAYIPVGQVARLLDAKVEWDNATKTATFTK